jgi:phosphopantetheinyl transferase
MAYPLFLMVRPSPPSQDVPALREFLEASFPSQENMSYFHSLYAPAKSESSLRIAAQRLGALSLLPPLLSAAGIQTEPLILHRDSFNRPYFTQDQNSAVLLDFNLSHSDNFIAAALLVGNGKVGIDIEDNIPPKRATPLIQRYCTPGEIQLLGDGIHNAELSAERFTSIWVMKEALSKQQGEGMPLRYDVTSPPENVKVWSGALIGFNAQIALCGPLHTSPHHPTILPTSLPVHLQ